MQTAPEEETRFWLTVSGFQSVSADPAALALCEDNYSARNLLEQAARRTVTRRRGGTSGKGAASEDTCPGTYFN